MPGAHTNGGTHALAALAALANGVAHSAPGQPLGTPPPPQGPPRGAATPASLPPLPLKGPTYDGHRVAVSAATSPTESDHHNGGLHEDLVGGNGAAASPGQFGQGAHGLPSAPPGCPPGFQGPLGSPEPKPLPLPDLSPPRPRTRSVGLQVRLGTRTLQERAPLWTTLTTGQAPLPRSVS